MRHKTESLEEMKRQNKLTKNKKTQMLATSYKTTHAKQTSTTQRELNTRRGKQNEVDNRH